MNTPARLVPLAEALARLLGLLPGPVAPRRLPLAEAVGLVLAAPLHAAHPVPPPAIAPTSAVFTFQEFAVPVIRTLAGLPAREEAVVEARLAVRTPSEAGRTEYVMVPLAEDPAGGLAAGQRLRQRHRLRPGGWVLRH